MNSPRKELRNLFFVLGSAVVFAFVVSAATVWNYGGTGKYQVRNVLIAPDILPSISYTVDKTHFTFDRVELSYYNKKLGKRNTVHVDQDAYQKIYDILVKGKNLKEKEALVRKFYPQHTATLTLFVRSDNGGSARDFQKVQVVPDGNDFRVELRQESNIKWAYFYRKGVFQQILNVIIPKS